MVEKECDNCETKTQRKLLGKIRGKNLCRKCRKEVRENHREETIDEAGIEQELISLEKNIKNESQRKHYRIRNPIKKRKKISDEIPVPKGSVIKKLDPTNKLESYLGFQESHILLKILMKRGLDFEEARESIKTMKEELRVTREKLREQNKPEEEVKRQMRLKIEELYNY